jgi:hypothetical protein
MSLPVVLPTPLQVYRGDRYSVAVQFNKPDLTAVDLTVYGSTWKAEARTTRKSETAFEFAVDASDAVTGRLVLSLTDVVTAAMPGGLGFDVQATDTATTLLRGQIAVSGEWTR